MAIGNWFDNVKIRDLLMKKQSRFVKKNHAYDVVIIGAGAAGIGCGMVLQDLGVKRFLILDRHEVGASFRRWPAETRLLTPSFTINGFGMLDLNAVALQTSPAYSLHTEHPTGAEYADYLQAVAKHFRLPIREGVAVNEIKPHPNQRGFTLATNQRKMKTRFVIWAAGEFQFPNLTPGFNGRVPQIANLFEWNEDGTAVVTEESDELTLTPGLFLSGPMVRHRRVIFCFIYKFRQRFAVIGNAIAEALGLDTAILEEYRRSQMHLDDLSCCTVECAC